MPAKLVVDSSVIIKWLNRTNEDLLDQSDKIMEDAQKGKIVLLVPELAKYEVGNTFLFSKKLSLPDAKTSFASLYLLPIKFVSESESLAIETYHIAHSADVTYYDASFAALAKQENAILVTDNPKHQAKIKEVQAIPLKDYR